MANLYNVRMHGHGKKTFETDHFTKQKLKHNHSILYTAFLDAKERSRASGNSSCVHFLP